MNLITIINAIVVSLGVPTIIGAAIYVGKKLQILDDVKATTDKTKQNVQVVCNFLIKTNSKFNPAELATFSPFQLTDVGTKFIQDIGFDHVFEKNKSDFFSFIDSENPKLKYDVEIAAIKSISAMYDKDYMQFLKVYFYNNPTRSLEDTAPTLGVYIRDAYLEEHPEITQ